MLKFSKILFFSFFVLLNNLGFSEIVYVQCLDGQKFNLEIDFSQTVEALKEMIEKKKSFPLSRQRLIFTGQEIENEKTLQSYGLQDETSLHLVICESKEGSFVLFGPSGAGKTTLALSLSGQISLRAERVSSGGGKSVTLSPKFYSSLPEGDCVKFDIMDNPGFFGTDLKDPRALLKEAEAAMLRHYREKRESVDAFLLIESLAGDRMKIEEGLRRLQEIFGECALKSTILVLTKDTKAQRDPEDYTIRLQNIKDDCNRLGLKYLIYEAMEGGEIVYNKDAIKGLLALLEGGEVSPFLFEGLKTHRERIEKRAKELMEEASQVCRELKVPIKTQILEGAEGEKEAMFHQKRVTRVQREGLGSCCGLRGDSSYKRKTSYHPMRLREVDQEVTVTIPETRSFEFYLEQATLDYLKSL